MLSLTEVNFRVFSSPTWTQTTGSMFKPANCLASITLTHTWKSCAFKLEAKGSLDGLGLKQKKILINWRSFIITFEFLCENLPLNRKMPKTKGQIKPYSPKKRTNELVFFAVKSSKAKKNPTYSFVHYLGEFTARQSASGCI